MTGGCLSARVRFEILAPLVRLGAIDGDPGVRPEFRQFVGNAAPWERIPDDGLERHGGSAWASGAAGTM